MRHIPKDYNFTQMELKALRLILSIDRAEWLTEEAKSALESYGSRKAVRKVRVDAQAHIKRVLKRYADR